MPNMNDVLGVILGGGRGARLYPLTRDRAKPAVPIAGKYRLIDIPISNCINSGITRIAVLTQFNSVSLHRHIARTYIFDAFHRGWVQVLAAEQTPQSEAWYQGTADAVRKQMIEIEATGAPYVLILAGDHLYRMDYSAMADYHWENDADITVAVQPVRREEAYRFGLLKRELSGRITNFAEKPKDPQLQEAFVSRPDPQRPFLGSMGIYLFKTQALIDLLTTTVDDDFGGEVIPSAIGKRRVFGFDFDGFWEDIGTIRSFYETNLLLTKSQTHFNFYDERSPIYTRPRYLPGSILDGASLYNVLLADGCKVYRAEVRDSIIGLRSRVASGSRITDSILMGADYYDSDETATQGIRLGVGEDCDIRGAILDKNVRLGSGVVIQPFPRGTEIDRDDWVVRDGIVVIPKNTILPGGTYIGPEREEMEEN
jgi:glucose-1-phosphate adenylyltransferase